MRFTRKTTFAASFSLLISLAFAAAGFSQDHPTFAAKPALEGNRGPFAVAFTRDGTKALVTEWDEGTVAVIDRDAGKVLSHLPTGGEQPTGIAVAPDGRLALVTNSFSGSLAFLHLDTGKAEQLPLPGMPYGVALSPDGNTAYVSVSELDRVAVVDVAARRVEATVPVGRRPRALVVSPDGRTLAVANLTEGSVSFIDTASRRSIGTAPTPAVNLRGLALFPGGRRAYAVGQRAQNERPTETAVGIWSNQAFHLVPNGGENGAENIWLDLLGQDVAEPDSVVLDPGVRRAFITCSGGDSLNVLPLGRGEAQVVQGVGAHPKGLAFSPDGAEVWVANHLGNDVAVVDAGTLQVTRRIDLGPASRKDPNLLGRYLFGSASLAEGKQFSCNSCHPDGGSDGISWKFVHVPDAFGKEVNRNVKSLRGHIEDTAPFRWTGYDRSLNDFVREELTGLFQGPKPEEAKVQAIVDYVRSLPLPPNPYRAAGGGLTPEGERGRMLFQGKAGCAACHAGPKAGGARKAWIGTTPEGMELDVPHLVGVFDTDPYLHDGSAKSLESIFAEHNPRKLHGRAHELTSPEMKDLLEYVREL